MSEPTDTIAAAADAAAEAPAPDLVEAAPIEPALIDDELLVEEISIDGMCGVY